jgi:hypothetical protein
MQVNYTLFNAKQNVNNCPYFVNYNIIFVQLDTNHYNPPLHNDLS